MCSVRRPQSEPPPATVEREKDGKGHADLSRVRFWAGGPVDTGSNAPALSFANPCLSAARRRVVFCLKGHYSWQTPS